MIRNEFKTPVKYEGRLCFAICVLKCLQVCDGILSFLLKACKRFKYEKQNTKRASTYYKNEPKRETNMQ